MPQVKRRAKSKPQPKPPEVENDRDEEDEDFDEDEDNGRDEDENGEDENGNDEPQAAQRAQQRGDLKLEIDEDKVTVELSRTGNEANVLGHVADLLDDLT